MLPIRNIYVPVDFSDQSAVAAADAAALAERFGAQLTLVHIRAPDPYPVIHISNDERQQAALAAAQLSHGKLRALADQVLPNGDAKLMDCEGDPAVTLTRLLQDHNPDLIVMATHGAGLFRRFLVGSVTQKVLHDTQTPVLTGVHLEKFEGLTGDCKAVVCAVGLKDREHSKKVLKAAADWAETLGAELHAVHAPPPTQVAAWEGVPVQSAVEIEAERKAALGKLLEEVGVQAGVHVASEDPVAFANRIVEETEAGLLITGRSVRHGVLHWPHADAFAFIRESPVPVLSI